jgi:hypothetical protein
MPREITIPASTVQEDIYLIEEAVGVAVRVLVGVLNSEGQFDLSTPTKEYRILHEMYTELNGPPTSWAPDKPNGTYRNDDLWHFIDILRNTDAE